MDRETDKPLILVAYVRLKGSGALKDRVGAYYSVMR